MVKRFVGSGEGVEVVEGILKKQGDGFWVDAKRMVVDEVEVEEKQGQTKLWQL